MKALSGPRRATVKELALIFSIAVFGFFAYSNTFYAPFQWDEKEFIVENPVVKDFGYFLEPSRAQRLPHYADLKRRYVGYLTFAFNYSLHGLDVTGYHIFNLLIHILNSLLVYFLVRITFKTPFMEESDLKGHAGTIAFFSALLFITHPVQTEAVTYIFQRLASLVAFFYLLSLVSYVRSRLSGGNMPRRYLYYALSLSSAVLAMKTKENAFTLPVAVALYEFFFFGGPIRKRLPGLIPLFLTMAIIPLSLIGPGGGLEDIRANLGGAGNVPSRTYFLTELRVAVTYLRLLALPVGQNIDYDYPIYGSLLNGEVLFSLAVLLCFFGLAVFLFCRRRYSNPAARLIAFGIFWFYLTLSVESSVIPLYMVIDEYRLYLPSAGVFMSAVSGMFLLLRRFIGGRSIRFLAASFIVAAVVFSYATYARNSLWGSEISLWEDTVGKSPGRARAHYNLGNNYAARGLVEKAIEQYTAAIELNPNYVEAYNNLGSLYGLLGYSDRAIQYFEGALRRDPDYADAHYNLGIAYREKGLTERADEHFRMAREAKIK